MYQLRGPPPQIVLGAVRAPQAAGGRARQPAARSTAHRERRTGAAASVVRARCVRHSHRLIVASRTVMAACQALSSVAAADTSRKSITILSHIAYARHSHSHCGDRDGGCAGVRNKSTKREEARRRHPPRRARMRNLRPYSLSEAWMVLNKRSTSLRLVSAVVVTAYWDD